MLARFLPFSHPGYVYRTAPLSTKEENPHPSSPDPLRDAEAQIQRCHWGWLKAIDLSFCLLKNTQKPSRLFYVAELISNTYCQSADNIGRLTQALLKSLQGKDLGDTTLRETVVDIVEIFTVTQRWVFFACLMEKKRNNIGTDRQTAQAIFNILKDYGYEPAFFLNRHLGNALAHPDSSVRKMGEEFFKIYFNRTMLMEKGNWLAHPCKEVRTTAAIYLQQMAESLLPQDLTRLLISVMQIGRAHPQALRVALDMTSAFRPQITSAQWKLVTQARKHP